MKENLQVRHFALLASLVLYLAAPLQAATVDKHQMDEQAITQLEQRAQQANPREQCFLYTELVAAMTDLAGRQMVDGDTDHASAMLKKIEHYAQLIHIGISNDPKRVKNAEMLMHRTAYRLNEYIHEASSEDRATLQATLKQLNQVQDELLTQVFKH